MLLLLALSVLFGALSQAVQPCGDSASMDFTCALTGMTTLKGIQVVVVGNSEYQPSYAPFAGYLNLSLSCSSSPSNFIVKQSVGCYININASILKKCSVGPL